MNSLKRRLWQRVGNGRRESCSCFLLFQILKVFQNPSPRGFSWNQELHERYQLGIVKGTEQRRQHRVLLC